MNDIPPFDLAAELARIDRKRAQMDAREEEINELNRRGAARDARWFWIEDLVRWLVVIDLALGAAILIRVLALTYRSPMP